MRQQDEAAVVARPREHLVLGLRAAGLERHAQAAGGRAGRVELVVVVDGLGVALVGELDERLCRLRALVRGPRHRLPVVGRRPRALDLERVRLGRVPARLRVPPQVQVAEHHVDERVVRARHEQERPRDPGGRIGPVGARQAAVRLPRAGKAVVEADGRVDFGQEREGRLDGHRAERVADGARPGRVDHAGERPAGGPFPAGRRERGAALGPRQVEGAHLGEDGANVPEALLKEGAHHPPGLDAAAGPGPEIRGVGHRGGVGYGPRVEPVQQQVKVGEQALPRL